MFISQSIRFLNVRSTTMKRKLLVQTVIICLTLPNFGRREHARCALPCAIRTGGSMSLYPQPVEPLHYETLGHCAGCRQDTKVSSMWHEISGAPLWAGRSVTLRPEEHSSGWSYLATPVTRSGFRGRPLLVSLCTPTFKPAPPEGRAPSTCMLRQGSK